MLSHIAEVHNSLINCALVFAPIPSRTVLIAVDVHTVNSAVDLQEYLHRGGNKFNSSAVEVFVLLGCGASSVDGWCQTFRDGVVVSSWADMRPLKIRPHCLDSRAPIIQWRGAKGDLNCIAARAYKLAYCCDIVFTNLTSQPTSLTTLRAKRT